MYNFICYELIKKEQVEDMLKSQKSLKCIQTNAANTDSNSEWDWRAVAEQIELFRAVAM